MKATCPDMKEECKLHCWHAKEHEWEERACSWTKCPETHKYTRCVKEESLVDVDIRNDDAYKHFYRNHGEMGN